jgi:hypothetical protein
MINTASAPTAMKAPRYRRLVVDPNCLSAQRDLAVLGEGS